MSAFDRLNLDIQKKLRKVADLKGLLEDDLKAYGVHLEMKEMLRSPWDVIHTDFENWIKLPQREHMPLGRRD